MDANICNTCGETFEDPETVEAEDGAISLCPFCKSEDWTASEDCEDEESIFDEQDRLDPWCHDPDMGAH